MITETTSQTPQDPISMHCPTGYGMSTEQAAALLRAAHQTRNIEPDDPILMTVTLLNAYLAETDKMVDRHNKALTKILAAQVGEYVRAVQQVSKELTPALSSAALIGIQSAYKEFRISHIWLTAIIGVSAVINVAAFVALHWYR
jgi:hypothetical protein